MEHYPADAFMDRRGETTGCTRESTPGFWAARRADLTAVARVAGISLEQLLVSHPKVLEPKVFQPTQGIVGTKVFFNTFGYSSLYHQKRNNTD